MDCDRAIEQRAGVTVRQIFESSGEAEFRRLESEVLAELLRGSETVIATGGGAVLLPENRERLRAAGPVVWLHASAATLTKRLSREHAAAGRPSLTGRPVHVEVAEVLAV
ncbi:MAG: shikimate kinase, partial [Planctomyces sp.]